MPEHKEQQLYVLQICEVEQQLLQNPGFADPTYGQNYQLNCNIKTNYITQMYKKITKKNGNLQAM